MANTTITPSGGTGITSEMSVRLHHVAAYHRENGKLPKAVDGSKQFWLYRDTKNQNVSARLFSEVKKIVVPYSDFDHGWQNRWYDRIDVENLSKMVQAACALSPEIVSMSKHYYDALCGRTAVIYRGNDKVKEIPYVAYEKVVEMARDTGSDSFIVQTDELDFYEHFKREFPNTVRYENFNIIPRNHEAYILPKVGGRVRFVIDFLAALTALSQAYKMIVITGNIGLWCVLFRGNVKDVWQADGRDQTWRKLG